MFDYFMNGAVLPLLVVGILYLMIKKYDKQRTIRADVKRKERLKKETEGRNLIKQRREKIKEQEEKELLEQKKMEEYLKSPEYISKTNFDYLVSQTLEERFTHKEIKSMDNVDIGGDVFYATLLDLERSKIIKELKVRNLTDNQISDLLDK